jgi:DNA-binding NarL/FixJ family response regulator
MPSPLGWPDPRPLPAQRPRSRVRVAICTSDVLVRAGLLGEFGKSTGLELVEDQAAADVVVAVSDGDLRDMLTATTRLVLVADRPRQAELWAAIEHGLTVLVPRSEATTARLVQAVGDAHRGRGDLPPEQLGDLLRSLGRLHRQVLAPRNLTLSGLTRRETDVLRLVAEGLDTAEIAAELAYSERTVKSILQGMLTRLGLRNRVHAVAHGLRHGLI